MIAPWKPIIGYEGAYVIHLMMCLDRQCADGLLTRPSLSENRTIMQSM
ncbi:hypothetical protein C8D87_104181 [Lentzea atacamensis]|uniref:Uncharacterized protein n=1 Tax=Lentzea atacamensis TaxID=531938 RepID=A0ABX9E7I1_9PSEU|nr:hypothetical protein C8D87_104181 [Lentzea atacamensis]